MFDLIIVPVDVLFDRMPMDSDPLARTRPDLLGFVDWWITRGVHVDTLRLALIGHTTPRHAAVLPLQMAHYARALHASAWAASAYEPDLPLHKRIAPERHKLHSIPGWLSHAAGDRRGQPGLARLLSQQLGVKLSRVLLVGAGEECVQVSDAAGCDCIKAAALGKVFSTAQI